MKFTKLLTIYAVVFVLIFSFLNSRFILANFEFWLLTGSSKPNISLLPSSTPVPSQTRTHPLPDKAQLVIDKLGVSAPIVFGVSNKSTDIYNNLEKGVVHYSDTPKPGANGVSIILGHSSAYPWYKGSYGAVFALLGKLSPGDKFYIRYEDGQTFTFVIKQAVVFTPFREDERLIGIEKNSKTSLVLISCWPVGTNYKRIAIEAELTP